MKISDYYGDRAFWRSAVTLAAPIAFQNLLMSSFTMVDTIMVGRLGDVALSSVGMAGQWSWLMTLVMFGLASGSAVFISQYWGAKDQRGIEKIYGIMLWHTLTVAVVFLGVGLLLPRQVVALFNRTPEVVESGAQYLKIACWSYLGIALNNTFSTMLRSTEKVRLPMRASLVSTVCNAALNYLLIFGKLGFPQMGVRGAALATCISSFISPFVLFLASLREKNLLIVPLRTLFDFDRNDLMHFYRVSAPVVFNEFFWGLGMLVYHVIFGNIGYEQYAAVTIFRTADEVVFSFLTGLCAASSVLIGKYVGAGDIARARLDARRFTCSLTTMALLVGLLLVAARRPLISLFNGEGAISELTYRTAMHIFVIAGLEYAWKSVSYICIVGVFRAGGDTLIGAKYDMFCMWGISVPLTALSAFVFKLPFEAVYAIMLLAEDSIKVPLCLIRERSGKWIKPVTSKGEAALSGQE